MFAPHTNTDRENGADVPRLLGSFDEREFGHHFEFAARDDLDVFPDFPHLVFVSGGTRFARVLKTVAHVVVDEDEHGQAVVEKWELRSRQDWS